MQIYPHITKTKHEIRISFLKDRIYIPDSRKKHIDENGEWIRSEKALEVAIRRAKCAVVDYCMCNDFEYFGTITVNGKWHDITTEEGEKRVLKRVLDSLDNYKQNYSNEFQYILCPEYGEKKGRLHFHFICKGIRKDDLFRNEHRHLDWLYMKKRFGHINIKKIGCTDGDKKRVAFYCSKYITKNMLQLSKQRYFHSKGLKKPEKFCMHERFYTLSMQEWLKNEDFIPYYENKSKNITCFSLDKKVFYDMLEDLGVFVSRKYDIILYNVFVPQSQCPF